MSYPEPRFLGGTGEISATARPAVAAPEVILPTTNVHYLATGATTGGDFGLYRWEMAGPPSGPAPHFHRSITESFYVLSGHGWALRRQRLDRRRPRRLLFRPAREPSEEEMTAFYWRHDQFMV